MRTPYRHCLMMIAILLMNGCGNRANQTKPAAATSNAQAPLSLFEEITSAGVDFRHWCGDGGSYFFPEVMGSGVALLDYDRDGDLDIFAVQGMPIAARSPSPSAPRPSPSSRLYQQQANGHFADVTAEAGLEDDEPYGIGVAVGDVNNDGWPDLYVSKYGNDRLWMNREGRFQDVTAAAGIANPRWGASCCFVDYDRDGWLDLFVVNYLDYFPSQRCIPPSGKEDYCHPNNFAGTPARLFRNRSGETSASASDLPNFQDVSFEMGFDSALGPGLGVLPADWNDDGWPDLYVANDAKANFLWINDRGRSFRDEAIPAGAAYDASGRPQSSMGIAAGDVDGDGLRDLFMTHLDGEYSTLYRQIGSGLFEDQTVKSGLAEPTIPTTGFGVALLDLELDGDLDLVMGNGRVMRRNGELPGKGDQFWTRYQEHNQLFLNDGSGRFTNMVGNKDGFLAMPHVTRGLATGDLDADGDLDLVTTEVNGPLRIFMNVAPRQGNWLQVRAIYPEFGGRDAIGSIATVVVGRRRWQRDIIAASSYLSSCDPCAHFGLGNTKHYDHIEIRWPDGTKERFQGGETDHTVVVERGSGEQL